MPEKTKNNFQIPEYTDAADIPGMVRGNMENAEKILEAINKTLSDLQVNVNSFDSALQVLQSTLGTLSDELDKANGETVEEVAEE